MVNDRDGITVRDDELLSVEEEYELWEWARAAGVSAEDLRRALQHNDTHAEIDLGVTSGA